MVQLRKGRPTYFSAADARLLGNDGMPTFVVQWDSHQTDFTDHARPLWRALLVEGENGAAATIGSTTLFGLSSGFSAPLYQQMLSAGATVGDAMVAAKQGLSANMTALQMGVNLLGDPSLTVLSPTQ